MLLVDAAPVPPQLSVSYFYQGGAGHDNQQLCCQRGLTWFEEKAKESQTSDVVNKKKQTVGNEQGNVHLC